MDNASKAKKNLKSAKFTDQGTTLDPAHKYNDKDEVSIKVLVLFMVHVLLPETQISPRLGLC
jgi:hypothetical protein